MKQSDGEWDLQQRHSIWPHRSDINWLEKSKRGGGEAGRRGDSQESNEQHDHLSLEAEIGLQSPTYHRRATNPP